MRRVLVCGGGFGGVATATTLRRLVPPSELEIVLIDRRADFVMGFRNTWAALGMAPLEGGRRSLRDIDDISFRNAEITGVDPSSRRVQIDGTPIEGDFLVLALGTERADAAVPGAAEIGIDTWQRDAAAAAWARLSELRHGRLLIAILGLPYTCPAAPFELALLARQRLGAGVSVSVSSPAALALPVVGATQSAKVEQLLAERDVDFLAGRQPVSIRPGTVDYADGSQEAFDTLLVVPQDRCPRVLVDAGLANAGAWVQPDRATMELAMRDVYAIGDCTGIVLANGLSLPKAGVFAESQGQVVAARIAARLKGQRPDAAFDGYGACFIESGNGEAAKGEGRFFADPVDVEIVPPSRSGLAEKQAYERTRLATWFGQ